MIKAFAVPLVILIALWVALIAAFGWMGLGIAVLLSIGLLVYLGIRIRRLINTMAGAANQSDAPLDSIVLLKGYFQDPTQAEVEAAVHRAWGENGRQVSGPHPLPENGGVGYGIACGDLRLSLICAQGRYNPPTQELLDKLPEDIREAFSQHTRWLAVDSQMEPGEARDEELFPAIAKLIAEFADGDCLMVYTPTFNKGSVWKDAMRETLRGVDPLSVFGQGPHERIEINNIRQVASDDAAMLAAIDEARTRFPEFAAAFGSAPAKDGFLVKARFEEDDEVEHMWISVTEVTESLIYGKLLNQPNWITNVREGQFVEVERERLSDWAYPGRDGEFVGNFSEKVLRG